MFLAFITIIKDAIQPMIIDIHSDDFNILSESFSFSDTYLDTACDNPIDKIKLSIVAIDIIIEYIPYSAGPRSRPNPICKA